MLYIVISKEKEDNRGGERGDLRGNEEEWGEWSIIYRGEIREE